MLVDAIPFEGFDPEDYTLAPADATRLVDEGDTIALGSRVIEVLHTPGHSPGGICLLDREAGILFSGDTIYDSRLFAPRRYCRIAAYVHGRIAGYVRTVARLRSLAGIRMVCPASR